MNKPYKDTKSGNKLIKKLNLHFISVGGGEGEGVKRKNKLEFGRKGLKNKNKSKKKHFFVVKSFLPRFHLRKISKNIKNIIQ